MALEFGTVPERPISVDEFEKMLEFGIIKPDERLELVEGRIVPLPTMNPPHASAVARLVDVLNRALSGRALVWPQLPVVLSERSKPLPDVAVVRLREDYYATRLPRPEDVLAAIEVSDAMIEYDRGVKLRLYGKAALREYWIVDVNAKTIEVYREPHDLGYGVRAVAAKGRSVAFTAFPDVVLPVGELLG